MPNRMRGGKIGSKKMTEVARRAGVSLSTVSRALAGHTRISDATRRRVREIADSLGYHPDASASNLRTGVTRTIAVVIPLTHATRQRLSDPFFLELLGALADELATRGYNLLLSKITRSPAEWITGLLKTKRADGVIVIGQSVHHEDLNEVAATDPRVVVWGARMKGQRYVTVGSDNESGAYRATEHLIEQGCRRILFLGDPAVPEVRARLEGYLRALASAGISRTPSLEVPVRFGSDAAYDGVSSLLDAHAQFDGVFACSDVIAVSAMRALIERGRRVPADVAVVGFDDIPFAAYTTPPLTTVRQDCVAGARLLVDRLLQLMAGEHAASETISIELVVRASSLRQHHRHADVTSRDRPARAGATVRSGSRVVK